MAVLVKQDRPTVEVKVLQAGDRIANWVVVRPLGEGGMGSVYLCRSAMSDRILAAVKVLKPSHIEDEMGRFVREVEALDALRHHAVVRVKGFGDDPARGLLWLAMEYVEGEDLEQRRQRGPMDPSEAGRVFAEVASGLADAHANRICHRDIKPANIVLCKDGSARIVDFGIAVQSDRTRLTAAALVVGTPAYMAPEIFDGESPDLAKADIYALGQVLHEALIGAAAFPADPAMSTGQSMMRLIGRKTRGEPLDPGPGAPDALREVVRRATAPRTTDRYQTMAELAAALAAVRDATMPETRWVHAPRAEPARQAPTPPLLEQDPLQAHMRGHPSPSPVASASRSTGRSPGVVAAVGGGVVALLGALALAVGLGGVGVWWVVGRDSPPDLTVTGRVEPIAANDTGQQPGPPPTTAAPGPDALPAAVDMPEPMGKVQPTTASSEPITTPTESVGTTDPTVLQGSTGAPTSVLVAPALTVPVPAPMPAAPLPTAAAALEPRPKEFANSTVQPPSAQHIQSDDPELKQYAATAGAAFTEHFSPPRLMVAINPGVRAIYNIDFDPDTGRVIRWSAYQSSGFEGYDRAVERAIGEVIRVPLPPEKFKEVVGSRLTITFLPPSGGG